MKRGTFSCRLKSWSSSSSEEERSSSESDMDRGGVRVLLIKLALENGQTVVS